jgi:sterol desaturase/sphingolipid hydroxylase (fatty acid hydroxylase superfamily)
MDMKLRRALGGVVARAAYPGIVVSSLVLAAVLLAHGVSVGATASIAFIAVLLVTAALERVSPHERAWNPPLAEVRQDVGYLALAAVLQLVGKLAGLALAAGVSLAIVAALGPRSAGDVPLWVRLVLAVALADFGKYGLHRLAHERLWWWRFHAEHHAPPRMYSLNATRLHPVNLLWNVALDAAAPVLLGLDAHTIVLVAVFRGTVSVLQHANVRLVLGPLSWILSTPELHQWHHSKALGEANANYGSTLILWDVLFGTRKLPRDRRAPVALGLADGAPHPVGLRHQLVWPWCAKRASTCRSLRGWKDIGGELAAGVALSGRTPRSRRPPGPRTPSRARQRLTAS